jgi:hypothetical protein
MKKIFLALFVAIAATVSFSACQSETEDITLTDIAGATFEGTDSSDSRYSITFANVGTTFEFSITDKGEDGKYPTTPSSSYTGAFTVEANVVTLAYATDNGTIEWLTGDGPKKLLYATITIAGVNEEVVLKKK